MTHPALMSVWVNRAASHQSVVVLQTIHGAVMPLSEENRRSEAFILGSVLRRWIFPR